MTSHNQSSHRQGQNEMGLLWVLLLLVAAIIALPAVILGLLVPQLVGIRSWSFPFWFALAICGGVLTYMLYTHGLEHLLLIQFTTYVQTVKVHQGNLGQWNISLLWSHTWPVWIRTLVLMPIIAFWQEIGSQMRGGRAGSLEKQEHSRQQRIARSKKQAAHRVRRPEKLPEEIKEQMVIGITIDDDYTE